MRVGIRRALYWTPRILSIAFALFLSVFALDVFEGASGFWEVVSALLIHLIPVYVVLLFAAVAWRWEWVGAVAFPALAVLYIVATYGKFPPLNYVIMTGPLFLIAVLFFINWVFRARLRPKRGR